MLIANNRLMIQHIRVVDNLFDSPVPISDIKREWKNVNFGFVRWHKPDNLPVEDARIELEELPLFETINLTRKVARKMVSLLSMVAKYSFTVIFSRKPF